MTIHVFAASTGSGIAMAIGGIAAVLVISAVFYAIGRGEDRDRAATAARAAEPDDEPDEERELQPPAAGERRLTAPPRRRPR